MFVLVDLAFLLGRAALVVLLASIPAFAITYACVCLVSILHVLRHISIIVVVPDLRVLLGLLRLLAFCFMFVSSTRYSCSSCSVCRLASVALRVLVAIIVLIIITCSSCYARYHCYSLLSLPLFCFLLHASRYFLAFLGLLPSSCSS